MPDSPPRQPDNNADNTADGTVGPTPAPGTTGAPATLLLCGARLTDGRTVDVRVNSNHIEAVGTAGSLTTHGTRIDLRGYLLLPAPAEPHAHSDTALTALPAPPTDGTTAPAATGTPGTPGVPGRQAPVSHCAESIQRRATEAALLQLSHGATALRTHVRIGDIHGLTALEAVLRARRSLRGHADLTPVAMPRLLTGIAGADNLAMLRDAAQMSAIAIGGCPGLDPDPAGYTEAVLDIAAEHGLPVDLHTDADNPAHLARLAAMAGGLRPDVSIGPCASLSRLPHETADRAAGQLAAAGVTVICLPQGACAGSEHRGTAPVRLLRTAGVRVAAGSGALRDLANPVGRGDPLEAAYLLASQAGLPAEDAYDTVSATARAAMGLPRVRVEAGFPAELLAVRGEHLSGVLSLAYGRIVIHRGRIVTRTSAVREYRGLTTAVALGLPHQGRTDAGRHGPTP